MKKKDLIFYAGTAVLLAFSTHQVKADEQHASDQTPENTSAVVAKTTTSSETQNTVNEGVGVEKGVQTENTVATEAAPITPTISDNPSSEQVTSEKGATEHPAPAVVASRAPYGARARVVAARNESILTVDTEIIKQKPSVKLEVKNVKSGSYDVVVSNIQSPNGIREILLPSWTSKNGEDDVVWNQGIKQSDGTYTYTVKSSDHHNETGMYQTNVYLVDESGHKHFLRDTFVRVNMPAEKPSVKLEVKNVKSGSYDVVVSNIQSPNGIREILLPSWTSKNGEDDVVWNQGIKQSDGTYTYTVKSSDHHNETGMYQTNVYLVDESGHKHFLRDTFVRVNMPAEKPTGTLLIQNNNKDTGTFDVIIKDVYSPKGVRTVQVPIWSAKDGQDDIRWYEAARQANGDYKVSVTASDHKNSTGLYYVHLYYIQNDGSRVGVLASSTEVEFRNANTKTRAFIKNVNVEAGTYTVEVDQAPQGRQIKNVRVAAWSQDHQENLYWYSTAPTGTQTDVQVSAVNHKNFAGNYTTHVYVDYVDGGVEGFNLGQTALNPRGTTGQTGLSPRVDSGQRDRVLRAAASLVGVRGGSAAHQQLVNDYNSVRPLPVGYAVKNTDDWCDVFVTTIFQREGLSDLVGRECGVERHIQIFKRLGIWNEDGGSTPKAGDIITFNWDQDSQPNNGFADHIGIVESVSNGIIHTIEGNSNDQVRRKTYRIGHGNIRGFASPRYQ